MQDHKLPRITEVTDLRGKRVFLRGSLNVPVEDGVATDTFRLERGLATIEYLTKNGARVILAGHIGRDIDETLLPVYRELLKRRKLTFTYEVLGAETDACIAAMQDGDVVLLENLRSDEWEKENDPEFARELAALADIYVNDAFSDSHRAHASIVGIPKYVPSYAGVNFAHEYEELTKVRTPARPALFLLGGAKFDTKMPLVEKFLDEYDHIFVGGALAHDFFVAQGFSVGESLVSGADVTTNGLVRNPKILLPVDVVVSKGEETRTTTPDDVQSDERIVDAGPETVRMLAEYIQNAATVLWNGPVGDYEHGHGDATEEIARQIAAATGYSLIGGGDTVAAISSLGIEERFSFLSTAGGAMLTFLEYGTLAGIDALRESALK